jgi:hypothetical protein
VTATIAAEAGALAPAPAEEAAVAGADQMSSRRRRLWCALAVLTYVVLALLAFLPYGPFDASHLPAVVDSPAGSDPYQMTWFLAWFPYAISHHLNIFQTTRFEYPYGANLADNTIVPLLGFVAWPVTATLGPVASFNFLIRLCFATDGIVMFFVLQRWSRSLLAPFLGGLLYAFGPYTAAQELHIDLLFVPIPPLLVLCTDELFVRQRMRPRRLGLVIGLLMTAEQFVSPDVLAGSLVVISIAAAGLAFTHRQLVREKLPYILRATAVAALAFGVLAGYMVWEMVAGPRHLVGPVIGVSALQGIREDVLSPLIPTTNELVAPPLISRLGNALVFGNISENGTYLGIPLVIMLVAIIRRLWHDAAVRTFFWLAVAATVLCLGSVLTIATLPTRIPLPEAVFQFIPLLYNTIPARYSLFALLFVSILVTIGLDRIWLPRWRAVRTARSSGATVVPGDAGGSAVAPADAGDPHADPAAAGGPAGHRPGWKRWLGPLGADSERAGKARFVLGIAAVVLTLVPSVPFLSRPLPWPSSLVPAVERTVPAGSVVLTYPYATPQHDYAMAWQAIDRIQFKLLGGYANIVNDGVDRRWPVLLSPAYPEELLAYADTGDMLPYPPPPVTADFAALRLFLTKYHVGAVVFWATGSSSATVQQYLTLALGRASLQEPEFAIWLPTHGHWPVPDNTR